MRLTIHTATSMGVHGRWAADAAKPEDQVSGITFSTAMPGGFDAFSCSLPRDPRRPYADVNRLADLKAVGAGELVAWEGEVQDLPDQGGASSALNPSAQGYMGLLDEDTSAAIIYVDQGLTGWAGPPLNRQKDIVVANGSLGSQSTGTNDNEPAEILEVDDSWVSPFTPVTEAWYDAGVAGLIGKLYYNMTTLALGPGWSVAAALSGDDEAIDIEGTGLLSLAGASAYFSPAVAKRYAFLQQLYPSTPAGADGGVYQSLWNLAVYGDHGLPIYQVASLDGSGNPILVDPGGVLASDVSAHAIGKWASNLAFTTGPNGTIQPSGFVIPQLAFTTPGTTSTIIKQAAQYELLDWAVWEGPTYWQNARDRSAKTRNWVTRVKPGQLQDTGQSASRLWNGVVVAFTAPDGTTQTVGPPGSGGSVETALLLDPDPQNPANAPGPNGQPRRRWALLTVGTTTSDGAIQVGQLYLQEQKLLDNSGQATLVGPIQDEHGVLWPSWRARGGDTLRVIDARDPSPRRMVSTSYTHASRANAVQLDQPPDSETALLQRLSASVAPFGFS